LAELCGNVSRCYEISCVYRTCKFWYLSFIITFLTATIWNQQRATFLRFSLFSCIIDFSAVTCHNFIHSWNFRSFPGIDIQTQIPKRCFLAIWKYRRRTTTINPVIMCVIQSSEPFRFYLIFRSLVNLSTTRHSIRIYRQRLLARGCDKRPKDRCFTYHNYWNLRFLHQGQMFHTSQLLKS
jgi:hypothetical protein